MAWNLHNPKLSDLAVRKAIAHAFDLEAYRDEQNQGLGRIVTGPVRIDSDGHPVDAGALEYDPKKSISMLEEAGWYDRNGNGIADKDGVELESEPFRTPAARWASSFGSSPWNLEAFWSV